MGLDKGVLGQVVGLGFVPAGQVAEKPAHRRLVAPHQLSECPRVATQNGAGDKFGVCRGHDWGGWTPESEALR